MLTWEEHLLMNAWLKFSLLCKGKEEVHYTCIGDVQEKLPNGVVTLEIVYSVVLNGRRKSLLTMHPLDFLHLCFYIQLFIINCVMK